MEKKDKVLVINPEKCTGCRLCEMVCAVKHDGSSNPARSRIRVIKWEMDGVYIPMACRQCQDAPCMDVCPAHAISRNDNLNTIDVDYDKCIGCRSCVAVCPFGAMGFNSIDRRVFKCDLCNGDPQCVRFCEIQALEYREVDDVAILKKQEAAKKLHASSQKVALKEA